jgi:hypothetical protein
MVDSQSCKWIAGGVIGLIGVLGLFFAAHAHSTTPYVLGILVFVVCVLVIFAMLKRHFDMQGGAAH